MATGRAFGNTACTTRLLGATASPLRFATASRCFEVESDRAPAVQLKGMEWAGHPLRSQQLMSQYIQGTTTKTGLQVTALLNERQYTNVRKCPIIYLKRSH